MKYKDMRADTHLSDCLDTELSNQLSSTYIQFGLCHVFLSHFLRLAFFLSCTWELLVSMQPHRLNWFWKISNSIVLFLIVPCCRAGCKHLLIFFLFFFCLLCLHIREGVDLIIITQNSVLCCTGFVRKLS